MGDDPNHQETATPNPIWPANTSLLVDTPAAHSFRPLPDVAILTSWLGVKRQQIKAPLIPFRSGHVPSDIEENSSASRTRNNSHGRLSSFFYQPLHLPVSVSLGRRMALVWVMRSTPSASLVGVSVSNGGMNDAASLRLRESVVDRALESSIVDPSVWDFELGHHGTDTWGK